MNDASTWREVLADTTAKLGDEREARLLCEHAAGLDAASFAAALRDSVTQRMAMHLQTMLRRRLSGEPLQYVMGRWPFRHLDLFVDPRVLIPRPETEVVAQVAIDAARAAGPGCVVADLGTGSGAIGLSIAFELPPGAANVWLTDISADALDVARANLAGIGRAGAGVRVAQGDWYAALPASLRGALHVVVANPPYIAVGDPEVDVAVARHEPHAALFAGADGLGALRAVVGGAREWLRPGGTLVVEIGHRQAHAVREMCAKAGLRDDDARRDLAGRDRIVTARA
jgi:release factor glutamine methyltransferase